MKIPHAIFPESSGLKGFFKKNYWVYEQSTLPFAGMFSCQRAFVLEL
jgi:hypothetical protein